jgi:hypothetical protein
MIDEAPPKPRAFRIVTDDGPPSGALRWSSRKERNLVLGWWRRQVCSTLGEQPRCLRIAWFLDGLFNAETCFAFPSDETIAAETGVALNKASGALSNLEKAGFIMRVHWQRPDGSHQRRIYALSKCLPPRWGQTLTPSRWGYRT